MGKLLTEQSSVLSYIKESSEIGSEKHYIGKLAGIGADFKHPTRNGRRYPLELWQNVEKSDDFKEGMKTHTIFGECGHPAERVETEIKEIAIVLTKFEINESEGNVYTEFHILDTPNGRILKELLDYGSQIGVSTRGLGDEIERDGEVIIDPDTFIFYAWDAVIMPAVKAARPVVVESKKVSLIESFNKEIDNANTIDEIKAIERVVNKLPELDSIKESINIKLKTMNGDGDNILSKLESDLGKISEENVSLMEQVETLKQKLSANNIRLERVKDVNKEYKDTNKALRERLLNSVSYSRGLESSLYESAGERLNTIDEIESQQKALKESKVMVAKSNNRLAMVEEKLELTKQKYSELIESYNALMRNYNKVLEDYKSVNEMANKLHEDSKHFKSEKQIYAKENKALKNQVSRLEKENCDIESKCRTLQENLNDEKNFSNQLRNENRKLEGETNKLSRKITEQKSNISKQMLIEREKSAKISSRYEQQLAESNTVISETLEKYLQTKCTAYGLKIETVSRLLPENYTADDIDKVVEEMADRKRRYDALPFATLPSNPTRVVESTLNKLSPEDEQTMTFLRANQQ